TPEGPRHADPAVGDQRSTREKEGAERCPEDPGRSGWGVWRSVRLQLCQFSRGSAAVSDHPGLWAPPGALDRRPPAPPPAGLSQWSFHVYDDFPAGVSLLQVADGLGGLAQLVASVDHRRHLTGLHDIAQD